MKGLVSALVLTVLTAGSLFGGPFRQERVAAEAQWVVHADVERFGGSQIGAFILKQLSTAEANNKFAAFQAIFNFDPRSDLQALTLYGQDNLPQHGVALIRGNFDADRLVTLVRAKDTYEEIGYGEHVIHSWLEKKDEEPQQKRRGRGYEGPSFGCMHADGTLVMSGDLDTAKAALDVLDGKRPNLTAAERFGGLPGGKEPCFFVAVANLGQMPQLNAKTAIVQKTDKLALSVCEANGRLDARLVLTARDADTALQIQKLVDGMTALALLAAEQTPALARLAGAVRTELQGDAVLVCVDYPVQDLVAALEEKIALEQAHP
ncbi:MAG: hypothetical protein JXR37_24695 [Kiritimatiellae bacterium]|nr:hypothetical protein [Kiritimatiellia bacterium]